MEPAETGCGGLDVIGGEDQVASLSAITEDGDDEDDEEPEDYTKVYNDSLWRVNQLVCPCCQNFNNSKDGNRCKPETCTYNCNKKAPVRFG